MIGKIWKIAKEVTIWILLVLSLWLVIGGAYKKDIGNLSDWISAACNIAMASAAIYAALNAQKWVQQRTYSIGFDKAEKLTLKIDSEYIQARKYFMQKIYIDGYLNAIEEGYALANREKEDAYSILSLELLEKHKEVQVLFHELDLLERWNIIISKKELIKNTLQSLDYYYARFSAVAKCAELCIKDKIEREDDYEQQKEIFKDISSRFHEANEKLDSFYKDFEKNKFNELFSMN